MRDVVLESRIEGRDRIDGDEVVVKLGEVWRGRDEVAVVEADSETEHRELAALKLMWRRGREWKVRVRVIGFLPPTVEDCRALGLPPKARLRPKDMN
jgi:hypothetical protein